MVQELRQTYLIDDLLNVSHLPRSTFYYHLKQLSRPEQDTVIKDKIQNIYHTHKGRYGYRRITLALKQLGFVINHKKVQRLMHELGLKAVIRRKRSKHSTYRGQVGKIATNVLNRDFKADKPNHKWATDVTEFKIQSKTHDGGIKEQKLYLSPIIDLYNGEIISHQMHSSPNYGLVAKMLDKALKRLQADGNSDNQQPILHSDQGWHYQMSNYQQSLKDNGIIQSMSRKGNCLDNAVVESFFGTLKEEIFYEKTKFASPDELRQVIDEYIHYYNHDRIKSKLKGLSPVQYRTQSLTKP
ncbi:transposase [Moraxella pluranimalium]|uniref:Transposase n=1 Tax=Moraxella pluranimalium TaxID=470453 RepID=A0A1T0CX27_9GAMM|nr:transposase [Moraxella pluranimalium]